MLYTLGRLELHRSAYQHVKPLLFLAYLSLEGQQERRHVAEVFWSNSENPLNALSALLFRLRRDLPGTVEADKTFVRSAVTSDAGEFLNAVEQGHNQRALELYQGTFLKDIVVDTPPLEDWLYTTREALSQRALMAAVELAETLAAQGELALAAQQTEAALLLRETAVLEPDLLGRSYRLLYLGGSPKAEILRAEAQEFELDLRDYETETTPQPTERTQHTLPKETGAFVGRRAELGRLAEQLAQPECRLITLLGPGGVGKSRLALELARRADQESFRDGVVWVALEALTSPELVPTRIADALGMTLQGKDEPLQQVISFVGDKHLLLVLDNFEHLTAGAASVSKVLARCPNAKVIATSRTRLNLKHEWTFALEGLPYRAQDGADDKKGGSVPDAQTLFYQRARRARLDFAVTGEDTPHLLELCQLVGGSPLALELAANWVRVISVEELVKELKASVAVLSSTHQDEPTRHQSMSAVLNQSWQRLTLEEQTALAKLSVFEGGFTREAAAQVADVSLLLLTRLIDKSLLRRGEKGRYGFHPLMKQFAERKLEDTGLLEGAREYHVSFFLTLAETAELELTGSGQVMWLERVEDDIDNLRVATQFSLTHEKTEEALSLVAALGSFWRIRGYLTEGQQWLNKALVLSENEIRPRTIKVRAKVFRSAGKVAIDQGDYPNAQSYLEEGLIIAEATGLDTEIAHCYSGLGTLARRQGDYPTAQSYLQKSLDIRKKLGDQSDIADALNSLGILVYDQRNYPAAKRYYEESLAIRRKMGASCQLGVSHTLNNLGLIAKSQRDYTTAQRYYEESLAIRQKLGDQLSIAASFGNLGVLAYEQGDYSAAQDYARRSLEIEEKLGDQWGIAVSLEDLGNIAFQQGDYLRAKRFYLRGLEITKTLGDDLYTAGLFYCLGRLANIEGRSEDAKNYLGKALKYLNAQNLLPQANYCLEEFGHLAYTLQQCGRAVRLWARASALREATGEPLQRSEETRYEKSLLAAKERLGTSAFQAAWAAGEAMTFEEAINYALQTP